MSVHLVWNQKHEALNREDMMEGSILQKSGTNLNLCPSSCPSFLFIFYLHFLRGGTGGIHISY